MVIAMRPPTIVLLLTGPRLLSKDKEKEKDSSSSSGRNESAYLKRREQVRRAQRTHRERKDQYFKTLESEVLQLRANEVNFLNKIRELETHIFNLQEVVKRNGIELPTIEEHSQRAPGSEASLPNLASFEANNVIHDVSMPHSIFHNTEPLNDITRLPSSHDPITRQPTESTESSLLTHGMEFVLTLERPCLSHIEVDLKKSAEPSGHVLTASMPLLNTHHYPHSFTDESPSLEVSKTIFDRLTKLSSELVDDDEFSPIQLWNYIVGQQLAYKLSISQLRVLAENLLHHVKCYGFGAVVEKEVCVNMVTQLLAAS